MLCSRDAIAAVTDITENCCTRQLILDDRSNCNITMSFKRDNLIEMLSFWNRPDLKPYYIIVCYAVRERFEFKRSRTWRERKTAKITNDIVTNLLLFCFSDGEARLWYITLALLCGRPWLLERRPAAADLLYHIITNFRRKVRRRRTKRNRRWQTRWRWRARFRRRNTTNARRNGDK